MRLLILLILILVSLQAWPLGDVKEWLKLRDIESPYSLLDRIDSIEHVKIEPDYRLNYLRSFAYYSLSRYSIAYNYALLAFKEDEIKSDTAVFGRTLILLAENAVLSYRVEEASTIIKKGLDYSIKQKDNSLMANLLFIEGLLYRKVNNLKESYKLFGQSISILRKYSDVGSMLRISQIMDYLCDAYISDGIMDKAWEVGNERSLLLKDLRSTGRSLSLIDRQEANLYSKSAYLAQKQGNVVVANEYYNMFLSTNHSKTDLGVLEINDYLLEVGRYKEVIDNNKRFLYSVDMDDSGSLIYQRTLRQSATAYMGTGNYLMAYQALNKLVEIRERHRLEIDRQLVLDSNQTSELLQYRLNLEKVKDDLQRSSTLLLFFFIALVCMLVLFVLVLYDRRNLNSKNKKITSLLLELRDEKEKSEQYLMDNIDNVSPDYRIFLQFDEKVRSNRLYLNYQMQRDDFAKLMGVDKNRFASIIKEYTGGGNLNSYLNDMRLEYSIYLLKNHPEMSIQEIGEASALPSSTTFYRLFKEKYDISPKVFREQMK